MHIIKTIPAIRLLLHKARSRKKKIGFVPTMGALHQGHLSLIKKSRKENGLTVISIFVNPAQFSAGEDYRTYPRDKKKDVLLAKNEKVDIMFYPSAKDIYPDRYLTYVDVEDITDILCGRSRPKHFRGVTTVIGKLLNIIDPDTLYLGQKDAQQNVVIKQMVRDLNFPVKVKVLSTVRDPDGLAISSRNQYLSTRQRIEAPVLYQSLCLAKQKILQGSHSAALITRLIQTTIERKSSGKVEYVACVDADSLRRLKVLKGKILIALAVRFQKARLIDNITFQVR